MSEHDIERDHGIYKETLSLWVKENPIKTNKLQVLLVVNGLLLSAVNVGGGFVTKNWPLYLGGAVFSLVWVLSIGRTSLYQKVWQIKLGELAKRYPEDARFQILEVKNDLSKAPKFLQILGGVSSKYYLIAAPFVFCIAWLCLLLFSLIARG